MKLKEKTQWILHTFLPEKRRKHPERKRGLKRMNKSVKEAVKERERERLKNSADVQISLLLLGLWRMQSQLDSCIKNSLHILQFEQKDFQHMEFLMKTKHWLLHTGNTFFFSWAHLHMWGIPAVSLSCTLYMPQLLFVFSDLHPKIFKKCFRIINNKINYPKKKKKTAPEVCGIIQFSFRN